MRTLAAMVLVFCLFSAAGDTFADPPDLGAKLAVSYDYSFQDKWYYVKGDYIPMLSTATEFVKNQDLWIYLSIVGYGLDGEKRANVTYDLDIIGPDGTPIEELRDLPAIDAAVGNPAYVMLGMTVIKFIATDEYLTGDYVFRATIVDSVSGTSAEASTEIKLIPFEPGPAPSTEDEFSEWMTTYYQSPTPLKAASAFLQLAEGDYPEGAFSPLFGFFVELFQHNQYQLPYLLEKYPALSALQKDHVLWLIKFMDYTADTFLEGLDERERNEYNEPSVGFRPLDIDGEVEDPSQLDWRWGSFFASGSTEPIRKLVGGLSQFEHEKKVDEATERYEKTGVPAEPDKEFWMGAVFKSARWSIDSNCKQHKLVRAYCEYLLEAGSLDKDVKTVLEGILES